MWSPLPLMSLSACPCDDWSSWQRHQLCHSAAKHLYLWMCLGPANGK